MDQFREQAAVLALASRTRRAWHLLSHALEEAGTALGLAAGERTGNEPPELLDALHPVVIQHEELNELETVIASLRDRGITLLTVLDEGFPHNLRLVYDRPPFLFVRGELRAADDRSIAVVGTRKATAEGLRQATNLARGLAARNVTVISGLALGIDGAAHRATLESGGRTIGVAAHGLRLPLYPAAHRSLAERIVGHGGAIVSQFLPDSPPRPDSFRLRNRTMSGLALGTAVIEASDTSGARMQARIALEHGKRVFLHRSLVLHEEWARRYAEHPGTTVVDDAAEILGVVDELPELSGLTLA